MVPVEIGDESARRIAYGADNPERRLLELDFITEARDKVVARLVAYRQRMSQTYNKKVISRSFEVGDQVWRQIKPVGDVSKLDPQWQGPYLVIKKLSSGAYYLKDSKGKELDRPWSASYLRLYKE